MMEETNGIKKLGKGSKDQWIKNINNKHKINGCVNEMDYNFKNKIYYP